MIGKIFSLLIDKLPVLAAIMNTPLLFRIFASLINYFVMLRNPGCAVAHGNSPQIVAFEQKPPFLSPPGIYSNTSCLRCQ